MTDEMILEQRIEAEQLKERKLYPKNYEYDEKTGCNVRKIRNPEILKTIA